MQLWAIDPENAEIVYFQGTGDFLEDSLTINLFFNTRSLAKSQEKDMNIARARELAENLHSVIECNGGMVYSNIREWYDVASPDEHLAIAICHENGETRWMNTNFLMITKTLIKMNKPQD